MIDNLIKFPYNPKAEQILKTIKPEMDLTFEEELIFILRSYFKAIWDRHLRITEVIKKDNIWIAYVYKRIIKKESKSRWKNTITKRIRKFNIWLIKNDIPIQVIKKSIKKEDI